MEDRQRKCAPQRGRRKRRPSRRVRNQRYGLVCGAVAAATAITLISAWMGGAKTAKGASSSAGTVSQIAAAAAPKAGQKAMAVDRSKWELRLVNAKNALPDDFAPALSLLRGGTLTDVPVERVTQKGQIAFDRRAARFLLEMLNACNASVGENGEQLRLVPCSGYRNPARQMALYKRQVDRMKSSGKSDEEAQAAAATVVAKPGTSEHTLGLAVDVGSLHNQRCDEKFEQEPEFQWMQAHAHEYGFILRYPKGKEHITGVTYEPWHYRYVGKEAAAAMRASGQTLEEYLGEA